MSTFNDLFNSRLKTQKLPLFPSKDFKMQRYFTGYLNMARQNCCIVLSHISQCFGFKTAAIMDTALSNAPILGASGLLSKKKEVSEMIKVRLLAAFPVLDPMIRCKKKLDDPKNDYDRIVISAQDVADMLVAVLDVLSYYRDMSSHVVFNDDRCNSNAFAQKEKLVAESLNYSVTVALRVVSERFSLESADLDFYNRKRYNKKGREVRLNVTFPHAVRTDEYRLSLIGLVYLCCQFVDKQYATMFFDALGTRFYGIAADANDAKIEEKRKMSLREMFSVFRVRIPKERLDSTRDDMALALDMLNELGKCPDVLFERIRRSDQAKFELTDVEGNRVLLRRNGDRFPTLALRYLDENKKFEKLRFHVTFGKYRWRFCTDKKCADGEVRQRWLQKELNGFGRLQEVERKRIGIDEGWNGVALIRKFEEIVSDEEQEGAYVTDSRTQYLFNRDKIGVSFGDSMPLLELDNGVPVMHEDTNGNMKVRLIRNIPQAYLSVYEIPAMLFLTYLKGSGSLAERIVRNVLTVYGQLFDDFAAGKWENISKDKVADVYCCGKGDDSFVLSWNDVPRKIRDKVTGRKRKSFEKLAACTIKEMIDRTERQLERFKEDRKAAGDLKNNKQGKDRFVDLRAGRLANFLIKDIVRLMPSSDNGTNKPTGLNYCVLQKELATYGPKSGGAVYLKRIFQRAGVIGTPASHPFLQKLMDKCKPNTVLDMYECYLAERLTFLRNLQSNPTTLKSVSFLKVGRLKYSVDTDSYVARLAEKYKTRPIYLPTGIFTPAIRKELERKEQMPVLNDRANAAWLVLEYFSHVEKGKCQKMYSMPRNYRVFDLIEFNDEPKFWGLNDRVGKVEKYGLMSRKKFGYVLKDYYSRLVSELTAKSKEEKAKGRPSFSKIKTAEEAVKTARMEYDALKKGRNLEGEKYFCRLKSARDEFDDCERTLRRYQVQDILLFLVARATLFNLLPQKLIFRLQDFNVWDGTGPLSSPVGEFAMDVTWTEKDDNGKKVFKTAAIKEENVVIKNYGRIFRLLYDDRIKALLPQVTLPMDDGDMHNDRIVMNGDKVVIEKSLFDEELDRYDHRRHEICEMILKFEAAAIKAKPSLFPEGSEIDFSCVLANLESSGLLSKDTSAVLRAIRNAYNHNKYPSKEANLSVINSSNMPNITERLYETLNDLITIGGNQGGGTQK